MLLPYFNSIKVRLEQGILRDATLIVALFQFHKGTIRTFSALDACCYYLDFNSIKVRLEPACLPRLVRPR